jgi:hypothetical protein
LEKEFSKALLQVYALCKRKCRILQLFVTILLIHVKASKYGAFRDIEGICRSIFRDQSQLLKVEMQVMLIVMSLSLPLFNGANSPHNDRFCQSWF